MSKIIYSVERPKMGHCSLPSSWGKAEHQQKRHSSLAHLGTTCSREVINTTNPCYWKHSHRKQENQPLCQMTKTLWFLGIHSDSVGLWLPTGFWKDPQCSFPLTTCRLSTCRSHHRLFSNFSIVVHFSPGCLTLTNILTNKKDLPHMKRLAELLGNSKSIVVGPIWQISSPD